MPEDHLGRLGGVALSPVVRVEMPSDLRVARGLERQFTSRRRDGLEEQRSGEGGSLLGGLLACGLWLGLELDSPDPVDGVVIGLPLDYEFPSLGHARHDAGIVADEALHLPARVKVKHEFGVVRLPGTQDEPLSLDDRHVSPWCQRIRIIGCVCVFHIRVLGGCRCHTLMEDSGHGSGFGGGGSAGGRA